MFAHMICIVLNCGVELAIPLGTVAVGIVGVGSVCVFVPFILGTSLHLSISYDNAFFHPFCMMKSDILIRFVRFQEVV